MLAGYIAQDYALPVPTVGENIRKLRIERSLAQGELAARLGVKQSTVSNWETDRRGLPETPTLFKLAKALHCSIEDLLAGVDEAYSKQRSAAGGPDVDEEILDVSGYRKDDIPVVAEGEASPQGNLFWDDEGKLKSEVEDRISRPFDVRDPKAYGVRVRGDSMMPAYKPGMVLVVSPNVPVKSGDEVYVQLLNGERLLKVARKVPGGWMLESLNPAYEPRFVKRSEIGAMHPVLWARRKR